MNFPTHNSSPTAPLGHGAEIPHWSGVVMGAAAQVGPFEPFEPDASAAPFASGSAVVIVDDPERAAAEPATRFARGMLTGETPAGDHHSRSVAGALQTPQAPRSRPQETPLAIQFQDIPARAGHARIVPQGAGSADVASAPPSISSSGAGESGPGPNVRLGHDLMNGPTRSESGASPAVGSPRPPRDQDIAEAHHRLSQVETWLDLTAGGFTPRSICKTLDVARTTIWRYIAALRAVGVDWSLPAVRADHDARRRAVEALTPGHHRSGRRPVHPRVQLDEAAAWKLDTLYVATIGASSDYMTDGRRTGSVATALKRFAEEAECPPDLREALADGKQPAALVRQLRRITPEVEARIRGEKHFALHGTLSRRDHTLRLPDGQRAEIPAGYLVEFDDMSSNQPFHVELPGGGYLISRQGLYARDLRSGRWIGVDLVARPREAYRAEDILRFLRRLMESCGRFDMLRLEQGVWGARSIRGYRIEDNGDLVEEEFERPAMEEEERARLQDGLRAIGVQVDYATSAHQKVIETGFNHLQRILATYTTEFINIGRHAGEFEHGAKQMRRIRAGSHTPAQCGFAHIDTLADRILRAFEFINRSRNSRGEIPDQVWAADLARRPLPALCERDYAAFFPEVRVATLRGGLVTCRVDGQAHDFAAEVFSALGTGYRVSVKFDPSEPTLGAAIYNRETSSANHFGFRDGDFITFARWECPGPQADVPAAPGLDTATVQQMYGRPEVVDDGYSRRQRSERFVRTAFRALPHPGQPAVRAAAARDGRGAVAEISSTASAAPASAPAGAGASAPAPRARGQGTAAAAPAPTDSARLTLETEHRRMTQTEQARLERIAEEAITAHLDD